jgi:hypothetical protein
MINWEGNYSPARPEVLPVVPVTHQVAGCLFDYGEHDKPVYDEESFLDKLFQEATDLYFDMETVCQEWGFPPQEAEYFQYGFALTYTAMSYQEELLVKDVEATGEPGLQDIEEETFTGFTGQLMSDGQQGQAYIKQSLKRLIALNDGLITAWQEYLQANRLTEADPTGAAFVTGGIMAHDLICAQINATDMKNTYSESVN